MNIDESAVVLIGRGTRIDLYSSARSSRLDSKGYDRSPSLDQDWGFLVHSTKSMCLSSTFRWLVKLCEEYFDMPDDNVVFLPMRP